MATVIKGIVVLFVLIGIPLVIWGAWKLYSSAREIAELPRSSAREIAELPRGSAREVAEPPRGPDEKKQPSIRYVLTTRFVLIVAVGLAFVLIPVLIWRVAAPMLETPAGIEMTAQLENEIAEILEWRVGPISVRSMLIGSGLLFVLVFILSLVTKILKR